MPTFEDLPPEMFAYIAQNLSLRDLMNLREVNKAMSVRAEVSICKRVGVKSWQEFTALLEEISDETYCLQGFLNGTFTLLQARAIVRAWGQSMEERQNSLLTPEQIQALSNRKRRVLLNRSGVFALCTGLITVEQAMPLSLTHLDALLGDRSYGNGIIALQERLFTIEQVATIPERDVSGVMEWMLTTTGLLGLREKIIKLELVETMRTNGFLHVFLDRDLFLSEDFKKILKDQIITPEQIAAMPHASFLWWMVLFSPSGISALRERLITLEQVITIRELSSLEALLSENGKKALRERLITLEQAASMPRENLSKLLLLEEGFNALCEGLITPEQVAVIKSDTLYSLFNEEGLNALRRKLITPQQVAQIDYNGMNGLQNDLEILNKSQDILKSQNTLLSNATLVPKRLRYAFTQRYAKSIAEGFDVLLTQRVSRFFLYKSDHRDYTHFVSTFSDNLNKADPALFTWHEGLKAELSQVVQQIQVYSDSLKAKSGKEKKAIHDLCTTMSQSISNFHPKNPTDCATQEDAILNKLKIVQFKLNLTHTLHSQDKLLYRHSALKQFVVNFITILFTGGLANLAYRVSQGKHGDWLFFNKTAVEKNIDKIDESKAGFYEPKKSPN